MKKKLTFYEESLRKANIKLKRRKEPDIKKIQAKCNHIWDWSYNNLYAGKVYSRTVGCSKCKLWKEDYTDDAMTILENSGLKAYERLLALQVIDIK